VVALPQAEAAFPPGGPFWSSAQSSVSMKLPADEKAIFTIGGSVL
jgi:hypothetical protein